MCDNKAKLYEKKARVMASISGKIAESGKHQQGWRYATSEDVKNALRGAMGSVGLSLSFEVVSHEVMREEGRVIVSAMMAYTLEDAETGATETKKFPAEAIDYGRNISAEKTFYKLYTTSEKYFLKTTFLVASGDELDSDATAAPDERPQSKPTAKKPTKKPTTPTNGKGETLPTNGNGGDKALTDFLARTTIELGLTDDQAKAILKELGYSGFSPDKADELFAALDAQINEGVTTPTALLVMANRKTGGHYKHLKHIENAIRNLDLGLDYPPAPTEPINWQTFLAALIEYGNAPKE